MEDNIKMIKAIIIGAGQRGLAYADYALSYPNEIKIVGIAEPRLERLNEMADTHGIDEKFRFTNWEDVFKKQKFADLVIVATQDRMHYEPVMKAIDAGYDILCEKPMSHKADELLKMRDAAEKKGCALAVCHVLRYSSFYRKIKELLDKKAIGEIVCIQQIESIGYWHMAHSFVRGNWRKKEETSPIIMAKCCHDLDILTYLVGSDINYISSFGSLKHFTKENRPKDAPKRCMDGCKYRDDCPYYAPRFYLEHPKAISDGFSKVISINTDESSLLEALEKGPYGRCVYACDNDVPDNQIVNMMYENGVSVSFTMCAFTDNCERVINIMGSHGQIQGNMDKGILTVNEFASGHEYTIKLHSPAGGHGGSDTLMMKEVIGALSSREKEMISSARISIQSHLAALAAEESREKNGECINFIKWQEDF